MTTATTMIKPDAAAAASVRAWMKAAGLSVNVRRSNWALRLVVKGASAADKAQAVDVLAGLGWVDSSGRELVDGPYLWSGSDDRAQLFIYCTPATG